MHSSSLPFGEFFDPNTLKNPILADFSTLKVSKLTPINDINNRTIQDGIITGRLTTGDQTTNYDVNVTSSTSVQGYCPNQTSLKRLPQLSESLCLFFLVPFLSLPILLNKTTQVYLYLFMNVTFLIQLKHTTETYLKLTISYIQFLTRLFPIFLC